MMTSLITVVTGMALGASIRIAARRKAETP